MKKKYSLISLLFLIFSLFCSCSSSNYSKLKIEMPFNASVQMTDFDEVIVTDFLLLNDVEEFDLNQELVEYFSSEIGREVNADIKTARVEIEDSASFENEGFWQELALSTKKAILVSGSIEYTHETRKALIGKERRQFEDPHPSRRTLTSRKFYTLNLDLYFLDSETGKILLKEQYKESKSYDNPNQTPHFAFFDLAYNVKEKLFRQLFGSERVQERYLITN